MNLEYDHIKNGDQEAFRRVFERYYPGMVQYAYRFLYDQAVSEDLAQEIFIDLWENAASYDIKTSLKGYLFRSVRNRCLNHLKSIEVSDKQYLLDITISLSTDERIESLEVEDEALMQAKAEAILKGLPKKMRHIFRLKVVEGYTYAEIAAELDISINTVKTQLKRARARITKLNHLLVLFWAHSR